ncbi:MAG: NUDIX domain-containing protein [Candidatus Pacebacteria bacterium]|nr:NUDIX domain-containing protein [Candidatus Paceibacterota bacterium]
MQKAKLPPKVCLTAAGFLVNDNKVLLVKHKKLGIWLAPGGHMEEDELPHQAAEREFWEETAIKVTAQSTLPLLPGTANSAYYPTPFSVNLHWISKELYQKRLASKTPEKRVTDKTWKLGCEQHLVFTYVVTAIAGVEFKQNVEETLGIGWFSKDDLKDLETIPEVRVEAAWVLAHQEKTKGSP